MPAIPAAVVALARAVQSMVDAIAFAVQLRRKGIAAMRRSNRGAVIVASFDLVAPMIKAALNAVAMIRGGGIANASQPGQQHGHHHQSFHLRDPWLVGGRSCTIENARLLRWLTRGAPVRDMVMMRTGGDLAKKGRDIVGDGFVALYIFMLAAIAGHVIISRVPVILHTPLMSGSNFIHGIVLIGAMVVLGHAETPLEQALGFVAVLLGAGNAAGGYIVTERMLDMFKSSKKEGGK